MSALTIDEVRGRLTLTVAEAAEVLGISRAKAYELARTGEIPTLRFGKRYVVSAPRLLAMIEVEHDPLPEAVVAEGADT